MNPSDETFDDKWKHLMDADHLTKEMVLDMYASVADQYDEHLDHLKSTGPTRIAGKLSALVPGDQRDHFHVIDIAAGTGRVGDALSKVGFKHLDALDPSQPLLAKLEAKGIYQRTFCSFVGDGHNVPVEDGTYDGVVISGGFSKEHLPINCLDEIVRILKPGGYFVNGMTASHLDFLELNGLEPKMKSFEKSKMWKLIEREIKAGSVANKDGLYHTYQKCV